MKCNLLLKTTAISTGKL